MPWQSKCLRDGAEVISLLSLSRLLPMDPHVPGVEQTLNSSTQALDPCRAVRHCQTCTNLVPADWGHLHSAGARAGNPRVAIGTNQCLGETLHQFQAVNTIRGQEELMDKQLLLGRIGVLVCFEIFFI